MGLCFEPGGTPQGFLGFTGLGVWGLGFRVSTGEIRQFRVCDLGCKVCGVAMGELCTPKP